MGSSGLKYYPCVLLLSMCILSISFAYLFWLANNKKMQISRVLYGLKSWNLVSQMGRSGLKYYPCVLLLSMYILSTSFAYLFWLGNNKKCKYPKFCMGYGDETWYVGSTTDITHVVCHTSRALLHIPPKVACAAKLRNSRWWLCFFFPFFPNAKLTFPGNEYFKKKIFFSLCLLKFVTMICNVNIYMGNIN